MKNNLSCLGVFWERLTKDDVNQILFIFGEKGNHLEQNMHWSVFENEMF